MDPLEQLASAPINRDLLPEGMKSRIPDPLDQLTNITKQQAYSEDQPIRQPAQNYGESQYDFGTPIETAENPEELNQHRFDKQSGLDRFGNLGMNLLEKTGAYTLQNAGLVLGAPIAALTGDISNMTDNFLVKAGDMIKDQVQEDFPIYKPTGYENESIWSKLTSSSWWADDAIDRLALTAGMFLSGGASEMAGLGRLGLYGMNIIGQSALNAKETKDGIIKAFQESNPNNLSDDEINKKASEGARNAFWETVPLTLGGSLFEVPQMFGSQRAIKTSLNKIFNQETGEALERTYNKATLGNIIKKSGITAVEHSLNEGTQVAISDYNQAKEQGKDDRGILPGIFGTFIEGIDTPNLQNNLALGFIQGLLMTSGGAYINKSAKLSKLMHPKEDLQGKSYEQYTLDKQKEQDDRLFNIINNAKLKRRFYKGDFIQRNKNGNIKVDSEGNYLDDQQKLADAGLSLVGVQNNLKLKKALIDSDNYHLASVLDNDEYSSFVYNFLDQKNGLDHVQAVLDGEEENAKNDPNRLNDLDQFGNEISPNIQKNNLISRAKKLREIYDTIKLSKPEDLITSKDDLSIVQNFLSNLHFVQYHETAKQLYLNEAIKKNNQKITSLKLDNDIDITTSEEKVKTPQTVAEKEINNLIDHNKDLRNFLETSKKNSEIALNTKKQKEAIKDQVAFENKVKEQVETKKKKIYATKEEAIAAGKQNETEDTKTDTKNKDTGVREALHSSDMFVQPFKFDSNNSSEQFSKIQSILSQPNAKDKIQIRIIKSNKEDWNKIHSTGNNAIGIRGKELPIKLFWNNQGTWEAIDDIENPNKFVYTSTGKTVDFTDMSFAKFKSLFFFGDAKTNSEYKNFDQYKTFIEFKANWIKANEFDKQIKNWYYQNGKVSSEEFTTIPKDAYDITLIAPLELAPLGERPSVDEVPSMKINDTYVVWDNRKENFISGKGLININEFPTPKLDSTSDVDQYKGKFAFSTIMNTWVKIVPKVMENADVSNIEKSIKEIVDTLKEWGNTPRENSKEDYANQLSKLDYFIAYKEGYNINFNIIPVLTDKKGTSQPATLKLEIWNDKSGNRGSIFIKDFTTIDDLIKDFNKSSFNYDKIQLAKNSFKLNTQEADEFNPSKYEATTTSNVRGEKNIKFDYHPENLIIHNKDIPSQAELSDADAFEGWDEGDSLDSILGQSPLVENKEEVSNPFIAYEPDESETLDNLLDSKKAEKAEPVQEVTEDLISKLEKEAKDKLDKSKQEEDNNFTVFKSDGEYGIMNKDEAISYIKKTLPDFINVRDIQLLVDKLQLENIPFGGFANNIIYLNENTKNGVQYHEVFHAILRTVMTDDQIQLILKQIEKETGTPTQYDIEKFRNISWRYENLTNNQIKQLVLENRGADIFQDWKVDKQASSLLKRFFQKIVDFYKWITDKRTNLDRLFNRIDNGGFRGSKQINTEFSKIGYDIVQKSLPTKGTYESKTIINTFVNQIRRNPNLNIIDLINNQIQFNDINNPVNQELLKNKTEDDRIEALKKLIDNKEFYSDKDAQQQIIEQVKKKLYDLRDKYNADQDEEDIEREEDNIANGDVSERQFERDVFSEGGYSSVSQEMRAYFETTNYWTIDNLGRKVERAIDGHAVFASMDQLLAGTDQDKMMSKVIASAEFKPQTQALLERLVGDIGWNEEQENRTFRQQRLLNRFYKAFRKEKDKSLHVAISKDEVNIYNAQTKDIDQWIFNKWASEYTSLITPSLAKETANDISLFRRKVNGIDSPNWKYNNSSINDSLVSILSNIGIDITQAIADLSFNQESTLRTTFGNEAQITDEHLLQLRERLLNNENPFIGEHEGVDTGLVGTLLSWARTETNFREDYFVPNYMDAEGKRHYSTVIPCFAMTKARELKEELSNEENINLRKNDPYFVYNTLLQGDSKELANNFRIADLATIGNIRNEDNQSESGSSYKHLDNKAFLAVIFNSGLIEKVPGFSHFPLQINETKKTFYATQLPIDKNLYINNDISDKFLEKVYNTIFQQEQRRIKGEFGKMANNEFVYLPILNNDSINLDDKEEVKSKIKEQLNSEITKVKELANEVSHLLSKSALENYGTVDNFAANYALNTFLNVTGYNQLQIGDAAQFKNLIDATKRAAGFTAFFTSVEGMNIKNVYITDTKYKVAKEIDENQPEGDHDDGQAIGSMKYYLNFHKTLGEITPDELKVLERIDKGLDDHGNMYKFTAKELALVDLLGIKDVTYGPDINGILRYDKDHTHILTKQETSYYVRKDHKWYPLPGKEELHAKREFMEKHGIDRMIPLSAVKVNKQTLQNKVIDHRIFQDDQHEKLSTEDVNNKHLITIDGKYHGKQVENTTKDTDLITLGTQLIHLIDTETTSNETKEAGKEINNSLSSIHQSALKQALKQLVDENFDKANIIRFLEKVRDGIEKNTPDIHLDYLFQPLVDDMLGDPNLPHIKAKFEQYYLAHYKSSLLTKSPGDKKTITASNGYNLLFDTKENRIITNEEFLERKDKESKGFFDDKDRFKTRRLEVKFDKDNNIEYVEIVATRRQASLMGLTINEINQINPKLLEGLGIRIPTQSHHSMLKYKIVEFIPEYYGSTVYVAPEVYHLSGADNDVDSLFTYKQDSYHNTLFGSAATPEEKWEEFKEYQLLRNKDIVKLTAKYKKESKDKTNNDHFLQLALKEVGLPDTFEEYKNQGLPDNNGSYSNKMLNNALDILTSSDIQKSLKTPATDKSINDAINYVYEKLRGLGVNKDSFSTISGLYNMWKNITAGSQNIGPIVNTSLVSANLTKYNVSLNDGFSVTFNGHTFNTFEANKDLARNKANDLSSTTSSTVDNGKNPLAMKGNLTLELMGHFGVLQALGVPVNEFNIGETKFNKTATLFMSQPVLQDLGRDLSAIKSVIDPPLDKNGNKLSKFNIIRDLQESFGETPSNLNITDAEMTKSIENQKLNKLTDDQSREQFDIQKKIFYTWLRLDAISQNFIQVSQILSLSKGFGADFASVDSINNAIQKLGLDKDNPLKEYEKKLLTFNFQKVLDQNANIRTNINVLKNTQKAAKNFSLKETKSFKEIFKQFALSLKSLSKDSTNTFKGQLQSYLTMQLFIKQLNIDVNKYDQLLHGDTALINTFNKFKKESKEFRNNPLVKFLYANPTKVNVDGKTIPNEKNLTNLELLQTDSRIKLSVEANENIIDGYNKLINSENENIRTFAKRDLLMYLLVKNNFNFESGTFIKYISPVQFAQKGNPKSFANLLKALNKELAKDNPDDKVIKDLTGRTISEHKENFINIGSRYIKNKNKLKNIQQPFNPDSNSYVDKDKKRLYNIKDNKGSLTISLNQDIKHVGQLGNNITFSYKDNDKGFITKIEYPDYFTSKSTDDFSGYTDIILFKKINSTDLSAEYKQSSFIGNRYQSPFHMNESQLEVEKETESKQDNAKFSPFDDFDEYSDIENEFPESEDQYKDLDSILTQLPQKEITPKKKTYTTKEESLGLKPKEDSFIKSEDALKTFDFGDKEGTPQTKEANNTIHNNIINNSDKYMFDSGETFNEAVDRVIPKVKEIVNSAQNNTTLVTHNSVYGLIKLWDNNGRPDSFNKELREAYVAQDNKFPPGSTFTIQGENGTINVVRHGETEDNVKKVFRTSNTQLTDKGIKEAEGVGDKLSNINIPQIISSPLPRTLHTSKIIQSKQDDVDPITKLFGPRYLQNTLKKDLGIYKKEVSNLQKNLILKRLGEYNKEHNTNHSIEFNQVGQSDLFTYKINEDWNNNHPDQLSLSEDNFDKDNKSFKEVVSLLDTKKADIESVLNVLKNSDNTLLSSFASKLVESKQNNDVSIQFISEDEYNKYWMGLPAYGFYDDASDKIYIIKDSLDPNRLLYTLMHEIIHAKSAHEIDSDSEVGKQWKELYNYTLSKLSDQDKELYGFSNEHEFIAEIFNKKLVDVLTTLPARQDKVYKNLWQEVYATIKNWLRKVFGLDNKELTLYDQIFAAATQVFEAPNLKNDVLSKSLPLAKSIFDEYDEFGNEVDSGPLKSDFIDKLKNVLKVQEAIYSKRKGNTKLLESIKNLKDLIDTKATEAEAINTLIDDASGYINQISDRFTKLKDQLKDNKDLNSDNVSKALGLMDEIKNFVSAYNILDDIEENQLNGEGDKYGDLLKLIDKKNKILKDYRNYGLDLINEWLYPHAESTIENLKAQGKEYLTKEALRRQLEMASSDIGILTSWMGSAVNQKDPVLGLIGIAVKSELEEARMKDIDIEHDLMKVAGTITNSEKFHQKYLYQVDNWESTPVMNGKDTVLNPETGEQEFEQKYVKRTALIQEFSTDKFWKAKKEFGAKLGLKPTEDDYERLNSWKRSWAEWFNQNMQTKENVNDIIKDKKATLSGEDFNRWLDDNIKEIDASPYIKNENIYAKSKDGSSFYIYINELVQPVTKYKNPNYVQFKNDKYYQQLLKTYNDANNLLHYSQKLRHGIIPQVENRKFFDGLNINAEQDSNYGITRLSGEKVQHIPTYFTTMVKDEKNLNKDLTKTILMFSQMANNFDTLSNIEPHIHAIESLILGSKDLKLPARQVAETTSKGTMKLNALTNAIIPKQNVANVNERLRVFIDTIFYGNENLKQSFNIGDKEISVDKITNNVQYLTAISTMAGNLTSAMALGTFGNFNTLNEAIGGKSFNVKEWADSQGEYIKQLPSMLGDIGRTYDKSLLTLITELYDPVQGEFTDQYGHKVTGSIASKLFQRDSLFFLTNGAIHQVQVVGMIASLKHIKLKNKEGKEISLYDAYEKKDGKAVIKEGYTFTEKERFETMNRLHNLIKQLHGNYNKFDKTMLQRYWIGKLAIMFRKHIYGGLQRRWAQEYTDYEAQSNIEGYYRTFAKSLIRGIKTYKWNILKTYKNMTPDENRAYRQTMTDLAFVAGCFLLFGAVHGGDDKHKKYTWAQNESALQIRRLEAYIRFYWVINNDTWRLLQTPAVSMNTISNISDFLTQTTTAPLEVYKKNSGLNKKGDNKAWEKFKKLIPIYKEVKNFLEPQRALDVYNSAKVPKK